MPTESCSIHYEGDICNFDWLPASAECPFKVHGRTELPLLEHPSLVTGSTTIVENPDGTQTFVEPRTSNQCQHDASFYANPDYEAILSGQQWEIDRRNAEAAAQQQQQQQQQPPQQ